MEENEPNLIYLSDPIALIGDLHGQYFDLLQHLDTMKIYDLITGNESVFQSKRRKVLFLGDYVDRGNFSVEVTILLMLMKIYKPKTFFLLRGNHQCREMTQIYNFKRQCLNKYHSQEIYDLFIDNFWTLPLAASINGTFFCVHGGLSSELFKVSDIGKINRFTQISNEGLICDLVWSDPTQNSNGLIMNNKEFQENQDRNCSIKFGSSMLNRFFHKNEFICLIRAHEVQQQGYGFLRWNINKFPDILTLFSAPRYCGESNKGAIATIDKNVIEIHILQNTHEPYLFENEHLNVFEISLPFMIFYVTKLFFTILDCQQLKTEKDLNIFYMKDLKNPETRKKLVHTLLQDSNKKLSLKRKILQDICTQAKNYIENNLSFL